MFEFLLERLAPLYLFIFAGFLAGRYLQVSRESVAGLLVYILAPAVGFFGAWSLELDASLISLPFIFLGFSFIICLSFFLIGSRIWKTSEKNILAFSVGSGNTGYFGIPVITMLLGDDVLGYLVLIIVGFTLFENTLGFYITARGNHTRREAVVRSVRLPSIYAFLVGLSLNGLGVPMGEGAAALLVNVKGAYAILGMMMIGLGVSVAGGFRFDAKYVGLAFLGKFLVWPALVGGLVWVDYNHVHLFDPKLYPIMMLIAAVPLPANSVAFATTLRANPEKAATAVLLSTLVALFYIPWMSAFVQRLFPQ